PGVLGPMPGATFGRCTPPNDPVLSACVTLMGDPASYVAIADTIQPPASAPPSPLVAHFRPLPNGSSQYGAATMRTGMSRRLREYSAAGLLALSGMVWFDGL